MNIATDPAYIHHKVWSRINHISWKQYAMRDWRWIGVLNETEYYNGRTACRAVRCPPNPGLEPGWIKYHAPIEVTMAQIQADIEKMRRNRIGV